MVLDTHTHAWGPPSEAHPWVNETIVEYVDRFSVDTVYTAEKLLADMDRVGVDEAVLVGYPICDWTDNWYTVAAAREFDRLYGVVMVDQFAPDAAATLRELMAVDDVLGFRLGVASAYDHMWEAHDPDGPVTWLLDAIEETEFWEAAHETDALVQLTGAAYQTDQLLELVDTYPDLTYVFDAFGPVGGDGAPIEGLRENVEPFADYDTVGVKVSHAPFVSDEPYPYEDLHECVHWLLDTFGRDRVAWGSDFPNVTRYEGTTYPETLDWLDEVDDLSEADRRWLESRAFADHVGLD
jgi:predicted TIM-barrel fold metal-dependent hydrolase